MNAAIAIGKTDTYLVATANTILKRLPVQSTILKDDQKKAFNAGDRLPIISYKRHDADHWIVQCSQSSHLGEWYAFALHVRIEDPNPPVVAELLTFEQLADIAIHTPLNKLRPLVQPINETLAKYEINTPLRIAHFLAQIAHESDGFNALEEYASGEDYEWREDLGNTQKGDGVRFKGRSFVQITGRFNYAEISKYLGVDFISNPELLATPKYAALGAGWFWDSRNLNSHADRDDFQRIMRIVNGGNNGESDRWAYLQRAKRVL